MTSLDAGISATVIDRRYSEMALSTCASQNYHLRLSRDPNKALAAPLQISAPPQLEPAPAVQPKQ